MSSTPEPDTGPATLPSDWDRLRSVAPAPLPAPEQVHAIEFSASGSEYFRIWIVNLLLTLVTLGLYHPWAKVRKLRYFYGNTRLAGHAFDFHGDPKRMLRGYLLVGALFLLYGFAGQVSPVAGVIALVIMAAIWPALLSASMRFRLAQTSWRGLRFQFTGETAGAYMALLPAFAAVIVMVALAAALAPSVEAAAPGRPPSGAAIFGMFASIALVFAIAPLTLWLLKRYQHDNYQFASVRTRFAAGPGAFYALAAKAFGLVLLAVVVAGLLSAVVSFVAARGMRSFAGVLVVMVSLLAVYAVILFTLQPYMTSRLQNLVWSRTRSRSATFDSALRFWPLARLMAVNWILVVLTLGLYWPFAAVALARRKLEAISVSVKGDLNTLVARGGATTQDASGDAAADLFGIDLGL